jgi:RNA polymerase sigma-70 factor, ECF subfamily
VEHELSQDVAEARRRFDEACDRLRPDLHRFCTRMTGSPSDGEDILQDALVLAFYRFSELRDGASLRAWIFRIAHNKCIDFLRDRRRRHDPLDDEAEAEEPRTMDEALDHKRRAERVLTQIVAELPPRERACVVLKDVLDWSLEEVAEVTGSSLGAVKAAIHRGREKLEQAERPGPTRPAVLEPADRAVVERYLVAFNRRDWDGVAALLAEDARLVVLQRSEGPFRGDGYFRNYARLAWTWKLALARVDGVESIVHFREVDGAWVAHSVVKLRVAGGKVAEIRDYVHVEYLLSHCVVT